MADSPLVIINNQLRGKEVMARISDSLGKPAESPEVKKFLNGAIMYIKSKVGTKADVSKCTPQSIIDSLINAATVRLPVDNKHYACLVAYKDTCNFQPEWRGYVAKIKEADASAVVTVALVFKGDLFLYSREDNIATYKHTPKDPFEDNPANITGGYCFIKTNSGSYMEVMSRKELDTVRNSSQVGYLYIWKDWTLEMYKKTLIRRACKVKFTEAVSELDALDNKLFNDRPIKDAPKLADAAPLPDEIPEAEVVEPTKEEIDAKAEEARKRLNSDKESTDNTPPAAEAPKNEPPAAEEKKAHSIVIKGLIASREQKGAGPSKFYVEGRWAQTFDKDIAEAATRLFNTEKEVCFTCHEEKSVNKSTGKEYVNLVIDSAEALHK